MKAEWSQLIGNRENQYSTISVNLGQQATAQIPLPSNDDELWEEIALLTGVEIPRTKVCDNHVAPFTAFCDAYFARSSMAVWKGSRGLAGKTLMLALLGFMEVVNLGANEAILGGSAEQARRVLEYQAMFWKHKAAPTYLLKSDPTAMHMQLSNGGNIVCLTASQKSTRGIHPQRLRLDEIDEMDIDIFDAAMGQTMESTLDIQGSRGILPQTVASSTHQHADGTMTEILRRAAERNYPVFEWCYKESATGWLTPRMIETKRNEVTKEMWRVEYEMGEPSIGNRAIDTEQVDTMFDASLGTFEGAPGEYITTEQPIVIVPSSLLGDVRMLLGDAITASLRITGDGIEVPARPTFLDDSGEIVIDGYTWEPHDTDNPKSYRFALCIKDDLWYQPTCDFGPITETIVCRAEGGEEDPRWAVWLAAHGYSRLAQHDAIHMATYATGCDWAKEQDWTIVATLRTDVYPKRVVAYRRTGRLPWPIMIEQFDKQIRQYPGNAVYDQTGIGNVVKDYLKSKTAKGMVLGGRKYDDLLTEYINAVESGDLVAPHIRHAYMEHKYATNEAVYGSDHLPDTICAMALANRATKRKTLRIMAPYGSN